MMLRRRLIPPTIALIVTVVTLIPAVFDLLSETEWLKWSLMVYALLFFFEMGMFAWMRQTMVDQDRELTIFGTALLDWMFGLVLGDLALAIVFVSAWYALRAGFVLPFTVRAVERSVGIGTAVLILTTGFAVGYEMRKARGRLKVHQDGERL